MLKGREKMALTTSESNNGNVLNTLAGMTTMGANFIPGANFLTPFGLGLSAIGAAQQGDTKGMNEAIKKIKSYSIWLRKDE